MNKIFYLFSLFFCIFFVSELFADPVLNLSDEKKILRDYHDSGAYDQEISAVLAEAATYFNQRWNQATEEERKKMVIVYDIDETAFSNYQTMLNNDFGAPHDYIIRSENADLATTILPTLKFYQAMQKKGVRQVFITGRQEDLRAVTVSNLHKAGYSDWQALYLEPLGASFKSAADFKAVTRKKLIDQGYDIVLAIGDQCSDLADSKLLHTPKDQQINLPAACGKQMGAAEDAAFKLPNPYYHVP